MTRVLRTPETFAADAISGFCDAYGGIVRRIDGGVARATPTPDGKVAVVIGGGSGHYPAFAGYVGAGMADAAVCGDVFASPSTTQIENVSRIAHRGGGVLLVFGNYAGDVLNFGLAAERLRATGIDVRIVAVTDDVASAPADDAHRRRGIAGDVVVFKVAGAAAEAGHDLDAVERLARTANAHTRSFGVAFAGCTLPGSAVPLFSVPAGRMALGLGVHGEPGIGERTIVPADELAQLLVERVLAEAPVLPAPRGDAAPVAVVLNGLGATKHEELFGLWHHVGPLLRAHGLHAVAPEVGELVTSLDMAGCSLTVTWLDTETAELWEAPSAAVALRRGEVVPTKATMLIAPSSAWVDTGVLPASAESPRAVPASAESVVLGRQIVQAFERVVETLDANEDELGQLDAVAGDGDHGRGMSRGARAALEAAVTHADRGAGACTVLASAAEAWADHAGGTSGALWGAALLAASTALDDGSAEFDLVQCAQRARDAVLRLGGAKLGDKTMVDAVIPFVDTLTSAMRGGASAADAWVSAAGHAHAAAQDTAALVPRLGRARPLAERSVGHPDPGAVSFALIAYAATTASNGRPGSQPSLTT